MGIELFLIGLLLHLLLEMYYRAVIKMSRDRSLVLELEACSGAFYGVAFMNQKTHTRYTYYKAENSHKRYTIEIVVRSLTILTLTTV